MKFTLVRAEITGILGLEWMDFFQYQVNLVNAYYSEVKKN